MRAGLWVTLCLAIGCGRGAAPRVLPEPPCEGQERSRLRRVAMLGLDRGFAVATQGLYALREGRWQRVPLGGLSVVDVTAARGALWLLARGEGALVGEVVVLRSTGRSDLSVAGRYAIGRAFEAAALAVEREGSFLLGGAAPALVRTRGAEFVPMAGPAMPVESLGLMPDEVVVITDRDGSLSTHRWGEYHPSVRGGAVGVFAGLRTTLTLVTGGAVSRGLPWAPATAADRYGPPSALDARMGAVNLDGQVIVLDLEGRGARLTGRRWEPLEALPSAPARLLGAPETGGPTVVFTRDGAGFELQGLRWQPAISSLP